MSRFNVKFARSAGRGPLATEAVPSGQTHEGGTGYAQDARSELFLRATASFAGEDSFYEEAAVRDGRMRELVSELATDADGFAWLQGFLSWLRDGGNMRTAPVVLAAEAVRARLAAGLEGGNRQLVGSVLRRADEPGEMLAYWTSRYGRAVPKPVKARHRGCRRPALRRARVPPLRQRGPGVPVRRRHRPRSPVTVAREGGMAG